jgi:hypothetical protein
MKTFKITFMLVAVLLLTVSGLKSEDVAQNNDQPTYKTQNNYDLLAHNKTKIKIKTQG